MPTNDSSILAFMHVPKAAGSTVATILRQSFRTRHCDVRCGNAFRGQPVLTSTTLSRIQWIYRNLISIQGHGVVPNPDLCSGQFNLQFYVFLRDPIVRCASEYQYRVVKGGMDRPFDEWIESSIAQNRMTKMLAGECDAAAALSQLQSRFGMIGLVERFDESLLLLKRWMNHDALDIRYRSKNVMSDNSIKNELLNDSRSLEKLKRANEQDRRVYDFARQTLFERQLQEYGSGLGFDVARFIEINDRPKMYPKQIPSLFLRECVYKPIALKLADLSEYQTDQAHAEARKSA